MLDFERVTLGAGAFMALGVWPTTLRAQNGTPYEEVQVRGGWRSPARAPGDPSVASSVISHEQLAAPGLRAADALRGQPGIEIVETGGSGAPATASIRGATAAQLPVYLAGVALNDDVAGTADLSRIPLWLIERAEIYRGNAPLAADRLGIGGAIFFEPRWPHASEVGASETIGSFGARSAWAYGSTGNRDASVLAGASAEGAINDYPFVNDHGTLLAPTGSSVSRMTNADVTTYDAWVLGRARLRDRAALDAFANATNREQGVPGLALVPTRAARGAFERALGGTRARLRLAADGSATLEARSAVSLARAVYSDPLEELALLTRRLTVTGARVEEHLLLRAQPARSFSLHAGTDVSTEFLGRDDESHPDLRAHRVTTRIALAGRQYIGDAFSVQPLLSLQCDGTSTGPPSACDALAPAGRLGASWTNIGWEAFANIGRYVRPPALGELFGVSVLVHGNPALTPESGVSSDIGIRWQSTVSATAPAAWGTVDAFVRWASDLISYVRSTQGYIEPLNVASTRAAGAEAQLGTSFLRWFAADLNATLLDPRDTTPGRLTHNDLLPFQSRFVFVPRLSAEVRRTGVPVLGRLRCEIRWVYQSSRFADPAGLGVIPEQSAVDAEVLAQTSDEGWTMRLRASDVFDAPRFDVIGFPLPGRSLFLSLEVKQ